MGTVEGVLVSETYCFNADPAEGNFTILNNTCVRDKRLSFKAKGLHTYFMSLPPKWKLYKSELIHHSKDGIDSINSALKELVDYGYVEITEQQRTASGKFSGRAYGFHAKPIKEIDDDSRNGFPVTEKPLTGKPTTEKPLTENPHLLNTNKVNTERENTELTNYVDIKVSESVCFQKIKELFGGEYPFNQNFEGEFNCQLARCEVGDLNIDSYLDYVYERTRQSNPRRSFVGLYRVLALSASIMRDYLQQSKCVETNSDSVVQERRPILQTVQCPICNTEFVEYDYYCPTCNLSVGAIQNHDAKEIQLKTVLHKMSSEERQSFDAAREARLRSLNRRFFVGTELDEFLKEYGILK